MDEVIKCLDANGEKMEQDVEKLKAANSQSKLSDGLANIYAKYGAGDCMCGMFQFCEVCDSTSLFSRLMTDIDDLINGPRPKLTAKDYEESISISKEELGG